MVYVMDNERRTKKALCFFSSFFFTINRVMRHRSNRGDGICGARWNLALRLNLLFGVLRGRVFGLEYDLVLLHVHIHCHHRAVFEFSAEQFH